MNDDIIHQAMHSIESERPDEAIDLLEPLQDSDDADALVYLGIAYVQAERPEDAVRVLRKAETLVEDHCVVALFLGRALRGIGELDEAEAELRKSIRLESEDPEAWIELGKLLYSKGDYREAARILEEALLIFPEDLSLRGTYALALYRLGDYMLATQEWGLVHQINPELMSATANYAYLLLIQNRVQEALPIIEKAKKNEPEDYRTLILQGVYDFQVGNYDLAKSYFMQVLEKDSENIEALSRLAIIENHSGNKNESKHYLSVAEKQLGNAPECWRGLCDAYAQLGMNNELLDCLLQWTEGNPGAAAPWIALAIEYDRRGMKKQAINAWIKSFELRGYIRINCRKCGKTTRIEYHKNSDFSPYKEQFCPDCTARIEMPLGLLG